MSADVIKSADGSGPRPLLLWSLAIQSPRSVRVAMGAQAGGSLSRSSRRPIDNRCMLQKPRTYAIPKRWEFSASGMLPEEMYRPPSTAGGFWVSSGPLAHTFPPFAAIRRKGSSSFTSERTGSNAVEPSTLPRLTLKLGGTLGASSPTVQGQSQSLLGMDALESNLAYRDLSSSVGMHCDSTLASAAASGRSATLGVSTLENWRLLSAKTSTGCDALKSTRLRQGSHPKYASARCLRDGRAVAHRCNRQASSKGKACAASTPQQPLRKPGGLMLSPSAPPRSPMLPTWLPGGSWKYGVASVVALLAAHAGAFAGASSSFFRCFTVRILLRSLARWALLPCFSRAFASFCDHGASPGSVAPAKSHASDLASQLPRCSTTIPVLAIAVRRMLCISARHALPLDRQNLEIGTGNVHIPRRVDPVASPASSACLRVVARTSRKCLAGSRPKDSGCSRQIPLRRSWRESSAPKATLSSSALCTTTRPLRKLVSLKFVITFSNVGAAGVLTFIRLCFR
eukprot:scaffold47_cov258-Pinguiococcus_pyrenoidosus.AAC.1